MKHELSADTTYAEWLGELKARVRTSQLKAAVRVNTTLLEFYWELGRDIVEKQQQARWGDSLLEHLSKDLSAEFPELRGFSKRNLEHIRRWYLFWSSDRPIAKQAATQLEENCEKGIFQIPWWHHVVILTKIQNRDQALFYVRKTIENNWSRAVLTHQIESGLHQRAGQAVTNFEATLPAPQSDLARETLKNPYTFDFLTLTERYDERELEHALVDHLTRFLLELGAGFAFVGRQYRIEVGGDEFQIDLLFYHTGLHCYVVVELKTGKFQPEFAGKLNFYVTAVDEHLRADGDKPTIGMLICKSKNDTVVEYALKNTQQPIGVSEYTLTRTLPDDLKPALPTIEQIEAELREESL